MAVANAIKTARRRFAQEAEAIRGGVLRRGLLASLVMAVFFIVQAPTVFELTADREASVVQDYWAFHAAGEAALKGQAARLYDPGAFQGMFEDAHGLLWFYPPSMLVALAPFGLAPYGAAKAVWLFTGLLTMGFAGYFLARRNAFLAGVSVLSPATFAAVFTGQISIVFAGLLAAGLMLAKTRPVLAGLCFGVLAMKPQLGLLVPFFLVVTGSWRAFAAACAATLALVIISIGAFGLEPWRAFFASLSGAHAEFLQSHGQPGRVTLSDGLWALGWKGVSTMGVTLFTLSASAAALIFAKRARTPWRRLVALTMVLTAAATPYFWVYDWAVAAFAVIIFVSDRPALGRVAQLALVLVWFAPLSPYIGAGVAGAVLSWALVAASAAVIFLAGVQNDSRPLSAGAVPRSTV